MSEEPQSSLEFIESIETIPLSLIDVIVCSEIVDEIVEDYTVTGFSMEYNFGGSRAPDVQIDAEVEPIYQDAEHRLSPDLHSFRFAESDDDLNTNDYILVRTEDYNMLINQCTELDEMLNSTRHNIDNLNWFQKLVFF